MTNFKHLQTMTIEELATWLDENGMFDNSAWSNWYNKRYCENCESIECKYEGSKEKLGIESLFEDSIIECAFCELADESGVKKCRFFQELDDVPDSKKIIELWLQEEAE